MKHERIRNDEEAQAPPAESTPEAPQTDQVSDAPSSTPPSTPESE